MSTTVFHKPPISRFATVGHWNDPDLLVVGRLSWGANMHECRMTPSEQLTHITIWSMLSAPLMVSCDMANMTPFTRDLLTNTEVIDVDQDPLGKGAERVLVDGQIEVWKKPLFDGTSAIAIFNRGRLGKDVSVRLESIGLPGNAIGARSVAAKGSRRGLGRNERPHSAAWRGDVETGCAEMKLLDGMRSRAENLPWPIAF